MNGCDEATAEDHTTDATTTVEFGGAAGLKYNAACIAIAAGKSVAFKGDFAAHPLQAGVVVDMEATPNDASVIKSTGEGSDAEFTFPKAGTFPYYCNHHYGAEMMGAVFVK